MSDSVYCEYEVSVFNSAGELVLYTPDEDMKMIGGDGCNDAITLAEVFWQYKQEGKFIWPEGQRPDLQQVFSDTIGYAAGDIDEVGVCEIPGHTPERTHYGEIIWLNGDWVSDAFRLEHEHGYW